MTNSLLEKKRVRQGSEELQARAREMRHAATPAETVFWEAVRGGKIGGIRFRRQHVIETFVLDFYCPKYKLVIEIDGEIHEEPEVAARDRLREEWLRSSGLRVIRFQNAEVLSDLPNVLARLREKL